MKINFPTNISWLKEISDDPLEQYSSRQRRGIRSILRDQETQMSHSFTRLDEACVDWFLPIYNREIGKKKNALLRDVANTTINNPKGGDYWILTIEESAQKIGGIIFSVRKDKLNLVYKALPHNWVSKSYGAKPALYADYLICKHAKTLEKQFVSHGKDRNPYGLNANIGLAIFKLSVGCTAHLPKQVEFSEIDTDDINEDALIFLSPEDKTTDVRKAILLCSKDSEMKLGRTCKYPDQLTVEVVYRS